MKLCPACEVSRPLLEFYTFWDKARRTQRYSALCCACTKARNREYHAKNRDKRIAEMKVRFAKNRDRYMPALRRGSAAWLKRNPDVKAAKDRRRRAAKLGAVPVFANKDRMAEMYMIARLCTEGTGVEYQVDHIVPLRSKLVCGLHWEHNLQVITKAENYSKSNTTWLDMP